MRKRCRAAQSSGVPARGGAARRPRCTPAGAPRPQANSARKPVCTPTAHRTWRGTLWLAARCAAAHWRGAERARSGFRAAEPRDARYRARGGHARALDGRKRCRVAACRRDPPSPGSRAPCAWWRSCSAADAEWSTKQCFFSFNHLHHILQRLTLAHWAHVARMRGIWGHRGPRSPSQAQKGAQLLLLVFCRSHF